MKKIATISDEQIKRLNLVTFTVFDCRVLMQKQPEPRLLDNKSRANWLVLLETDKNSGIFMELLFDECYDIKNPRTKALNKSAAGNPYIGFLYCPKSWPKDREALEQWKKKASWRYPRLQDCLRFMTGIFTDCGLDIEDFVQGMVKYDDLIEYVKAWEQKTLVGHPYKKSSNSFDSLMSLGERIEDAPVDDTLPFSVFDDDTLPF